MSGNQINLALTISQAFVGIPECNYQGFKYFFIWVVGDAIGILIGVFFYKEVLEPCVEYVKRQKKIKQEMVKID